MCITIKKSKIPLTMEVAGILNNGNHYLSYGFKGNGIGKNCLLIPIPSSPELIELKNTQLIGKELTKKLEISSNYIEEIMTRTLSRSISPLIVEYVGSYSTIRGEINHIAEICKSVDLEISAELEDFLIQKYSKYTIIGIVWESNVDCYTEPIFIEYVPINKDKLYLYSMDSHGGIPINENRYMNHIIGISIPDRISEQEPIKTSQKFKEIFGENEQIYSVHLNGYYPNGDMWINLNYNSDVSVKHLMEIDGSEIIF